MNSKGIIFSDLYMCVLSLFWVALRELFYGLMEKNRPIIWLSEKKSVILHAI